MTVAGVEAANDRGRSTSSSSPSSHFMCEGCCSKMATTFLFSAVATSVCVSPRISVCVGFQNESHMPTHNSTCCCASQFKCPCPGASYFIWHFKFVGIWMKSLRRRWCRRGRSRRRQPACLQSLATTKFAFFLMLAQRHVPFLCCCLLPALKQVLLNKHWRTDTPLAHTHIHKFTHKARAVRTAHLKQNVIKVELQTFAFIFINFTYLFIFQLLSLSLSLSVRVLVHVSVCLCVCGMWKCGLLCVGLSLGPTRRCLWL